MTPRANGRATLRVTVELVGEAVPAPRIEQARERTNLRLLDTDIEWKG
jgi:hypothetical protein